MAIQEPNTTRLNFLRSRLLPAGTRMKDVPPDQVGLTYAEYLELQELERRELRRLTVHPAVLPSEKIA